MPRLDIMSELYNNSKICVKAVNNLKDLKKFIMLPWKIYKGDKNWVPPFIDEMKKSFNLSDKTLASKIKYEIFLALKDNEPAGRICAAIDTRLNSEKNMKMGYFSLFECINDVNVSNALFDSAFAWFTENGIKTVFGPYSPLGADSDEDKGLLIEGFDKPPFLMTSYNPPYYKDLVENYGFSKNYDLFAYYLDPKVMFKKNPEKVIEYAKKRYGYRVESIDLNNVEKEIEDIKHVIDLAMPEEWPDIMPPSMEEMRELGKKLKPTADPDIIIIARSGDEPIGFGLALPDYNQAIIHMNGRKNPVSILKFLYYKKKIDAARFFVVFVVPAFRSKGVSSAIFYETFKRGLKKGYTRGEGSTIGEDNTKMRNDIESVGGQKYKTYRIYKKEL